MIGTATGSGRRGGTTAGSNKQGGAAIGSNRRGGAGTERSGTSLRQPGYFDMLYSGY